MKFSLLISTFYAFITPAFWAIFFYEKGKKKKNEAVNYASFFFLSIGIVFMGVFADYNQFKTLSLIMLFFYPLTMVANPILFIFFLNSLCLRQKKTPRWSYLFFLVPGVQFLISTYSFFIYSPTDKLKVHLYDIIFGRLDAIPQELHFAFFVNLTTSLLFIIGLISAVIISLHLIPKITRYSIQDISFIGKKRLTGFLYVLTTLAILSISAIIQQTLISHNLQIIWQIPTELFWGTGWLSMGYFIYRIINIERISTVKKEGKPEESLQQLIYLHFENEKPYLNSGFTLEQLAKNMNSNRTYISKTLKDDMRINFNEFINGFRISHAKNMLIEQRDAKLNEVAIQSGFNSYSTFFRAFKEQTGFSPKEFIDEFRN